MEREFNRKPEWWQEFFKSSWKEIQQLVRTPEQTQKEADFIEAVLDVVPPARMVDIPCGDGRLAVELAARGYRVTGVDLSRYFLKRAEKRANARGVEVAFHRGDMRMISWEDTHQAAFCMWGSFGYFDARGDADFIGAVSRSLRKGGSFLLDIHVAETLFPRYRESSWSRVGEFIILEKRSYEHTTSRIEVDWTFIHEARRSTQHSSIRIYTYREILNLLRKYQFGDFRAFGSLAREPFELGSPRCLLAAVKS